MTKAQTRALIHIATLLKYEELTIRISHNFNLLCLDCSRDGIWYASFGVSVSGIVEIVNYTGGLYYNVWKLKGRQL